jgi:hypothetical protein
METLTLEQLTEILGLEAAQEIIAQRDSANATGGKVPFSFLNKIADAFGNDLGAFGDFVYGAEKGKDESGKTIYVNKGTNLGGSFEFVNISSCFYYKKFVPATTKDGQGKVYSSNIMKSLSDLGSAVDSQGNPLPKTKEEKKAAGWKVVRMNAGLVRKTNKDKWEPCIWEVDGSMLFGFNNIIDKDTSKSRGTLSGVMKVVTGREKQGQIAYIVIDEKASAFEALPKDFFKDQAVAITDITLKMKEYVNAKQGSQAAPSAAPQVEAQHSEPEGW